MIITTTIRAITSVLLNGAETDVVEVGVAVDVVVTVDGAM